jgi:O-antigen ligase
MSSIRLLKNYSMRSSTFSLIDAYISLLAITVLSVAFLDLAVYAQTITGGGFLPKYAYFTFGIAISPLLILGNKLLWPYLTTPYIFWTGIMVIMNLLHWLFFVFNGDSDLAAVTLTRIQTLIFAALIGFLLLQVKPLLLGKIFLVLALVLTVLQIIDFSSPGVIVPLGTEGIVIGRASSTLLNANKAAESLILLSVLSVAVLSPSTRVWFMLFISIGVLLTFSRSGILVFLMVFIFCFWYKLFLRSAYFIVLMLLIIVGIISYGLLQYILSFVDVSALDNVYDRMLFFISPDVDDGSALERLEVVHHALNSFISYPFFGNGSGYTGFWSISEQGPHNQHLLFLTEYGLIGYLLFIFLIRLVFVGDYYFQSLGYQKFAKVGFAVFIVFSPFTHNMLDHLYWLLTFMLLSWRREDFIK